MATNKVPCVNKACRFVYPFEGSETAIREMRSALGGLCPACATGKACPSSGEQATRRRDVFAPVAQAKRTHTRRRGRSVAS